VGNEILLHVVADSTTSHLKKLVSRQKAEGTADRQAQRVMMQKHRDN
jgi:hypothetical protein